MTSKETNKFDGTMTWVALVVVVVDSCGDTVGLNIGVLIGVALGANVWDVKSTVGASGVVGGLIVVGETNVGAIDMGCVLEGDDRLQLVEEHSRNNLLEVSQIQ
jgi:hypothetical protein